MTVSHHRAFPATSAARSRPRRSLLRRVTGGVLLLGVAAVAAVMLLPAVLGYERYVIVSGSMSGTYDQGSVVYARPVPVVSLRVGDVITYAPPAGETPTELVTHRIVSVGRDRQGRRVFRTKGDANQTADPWRFLLDEPTQAKVAFGLPYVGTLISNLAKREVRMVVIGVPAVLIALFTLLGLVRDARRHGRQEGEAAAADDAAARPVAESDTTVGVDVEQMPSSQPTPAELVTSP